MKSGHCCVTVSACGSPTSRPRHTALVTLTIPLMEKEKRRNSFREEVWTGWRRNSEKMRRLRGKRVGSCKIWNSPEKESPLKTEKKKKENASTQWVSLETESSQNAERGFRHASPVLSPSHPLGPVSETGLRTRRTFSLIQCSCFEGARSECLPRRLWEQRVNESAKRKKNWYLRLLIIDKLQAIGIQYLLVGQISHNWHTLEGQH